MGNIRYPAISGTAAFCLAAATAQAAPSILGTPVSQSVVGDANADGITNFLDFQILGQNFNRPGTRAQGDFNNSGFVDQADFTLLSANLGSRQVPTFFGKIADTSTFIPSGTGPFTLLNAPVIDRGGNVAFLGIGANKYGIYRWSNGALAKVADNATLIPSGTGTFISFGQPSISGGTLAFQGVGNNQEGIYTFSNGVLSKVVNKATPRPDGGGFASFGDPALLDNTLAFVATGGSNTGAYAVAGAAVLPVVNTSTPIPNGWGNFRTFDNVLSDGSNYWFVGRGINQVGIYKKNGATSVILDNTTQIPGTSGKFTTIGNLSLDGSNLSFNGMMGGGNGIYGVINGSPLRIADNSTPVPGGNGEFTEFGHSAIGGSSVAFVGFDDRNRPGIYAWINGEIVRVLDSSVALGGKIITGFDLSRDAVVGNKITFEVDFADNSAGIYSATIVPAPVAGDATGDGRTDEQDFRLIRENFGRTNVGRSQGDLNADAKVDFRDFQIAERNLGRFGAVAQPGDADGDGKVTSDDFSLLLSNFGKYGTLAQGDFTGDGRVDFRDFQMLEAAHNTDGNAALVADANSDRIVDSSDFNILWANFGKFGSKAQGDFNFDGRVDLRDFQILEQAFMSASPYPFNPFGPTGPVPADSAIPNVDALFAGLVPEPSTGLIALTMLSGLALKRRRR